MIQVPLRRSEAYPLLSPDGGGDVTKPVTQPAPPPDCNVTCSPKRPSWMMRWPQFLSGCSVSAVFLMILFVIFYAFGSIYRLQSIVMLKYNDSKPTNEVYYHYIVVPKDDSEPVKSFSNYLSFMATRYPLLNFNVYLLIDDTPQGAFYSFPKRSMRYIKSVPKYYGQLTHYNVMVHNNGRDIQEIQRKHPNINISIRSLYKYTAKTPLQNRWRSIPTMYLPFYVRAYEVWKNGGVGLNIVTQNYRFNTLKRIDYKLDAILKQHSKNIDVNKYTQALEYIIGNQDEREFFAIVLDAFNDFPRIMYQTFYNLGLSYDNEEVQAPTVPIRTKRHTLFSNNAIDTTTSNKTKMDLANNKTEVTRNNDTKANNTQLNNIRNTNADVKQINDAESAKTNSIDPPQLYQVFDISRILDSVGANHEVITDVEYTPNLHNMDLKNYVTLNSDGSVMAAFTRNHPYLLKLLFNSKFINSSPRYVISETIRDSCFKIMHSGDYCDSVKIINNL